MNRRATYLVCFFVPLGGIVLAIVASNVIPSTLAIYTGLIGGLVCGLVWLACSQAAYRAGLYSGVPRFRLVQLVSVCVGIFAGYGTCAWSVPWLVNTAVGTKSEVVVTVTGFEWGGRKACSRPNIGRRLFVLGPRALCVSEDVSSLMKPGAQLKIVGTATFLGINAQEVYVVHDAPVGER